ncbi:DUF3387 domain-containing protein [Synechocystis salina LEGE 06155]|nr:DUF3387 domain-containing protein [Synechocystis salina LEGE 06155]
MLVPTVPGCDTPLLAWLISVHGVVPAPFDYGQVGDSPEPTGDMTLYEKSGQIPRVENQGAVLALSKAFALASASDEAKTIPDEVGFFQAICPALVKLTASAGKSKADKEFAVEQIIDRAVVSAEIVDILGAAGPSSPDISIFSDDFLLEVQEKSRPGLP